MSRNSDTVLGTRVALVQCTASKRDGKHPARLLYDESTYFRKQRDYAEATADEWFVQSAEYGLLRPDECVESYDTHAKDLDVLVVVDVAFAVAELPSECVDGLLGVTAHTSSIIGWTLSIWFKAPSWLRSFCLQFNSEQPANPSAGRSNAADESHHAIDSSPAAASRSEVAA